MANTTNLNLVKPAGTDKALVSVLNSNSDKIDAWAGTTNQALSNVVRSVNVDDSIALSSLCSGSSAVGARNMIFFTCASKLANDMPSGANAYGSGFIIDGGYYNTAYYAADDSRLWIGKKVFNQTTWTWRYVQMTMA